MLHAQSLVDMEMRLPPAWNACLYAVWQLQCAAASALSLLGDAAPPSNSNCCPTKQLGQSRLGRHRPPPALRDVKGLVTGSEVSAFEGRCAWRHRAVAPGSGARHRGRTSMLSPAFCPVAGNLLSLRRRHLGSSSHRIHAGPGRASSGQPGSISRLCGGVGVARCLSESQRVPAPGVLLLVEWLPPRVGDAAIYRNEQMRNPILLHHVC